LPGRQNANQNDLDNDGRGNACDEDIDGDGVNNDPDPAPYNPEVPAPPAM
jgi:thrombospondin 2/3/4/5